MLIRVRSNVGVWRVEGLEASSSLEDLKMAIAATRPNVVYEKPLCQDPPCQLELDSTKTLGQLGLRHGSMVHCRVDPETCANVSTAAAATTTTTSASAQSSSSNDQPTSNMKRIIDKDGSIKLVPASQITSDKDDKGFRKGMMPLRDIKMAWTLNEFTAMDSQFVFELEPQEEAICKQVSLDQSSTGKFQAYLQRFQFSRKRFGFLYGKFVDSEEGKKTKVVVEAIYEPPQNADPDAAEGFEMLDDDMEESVEKIAEMCGMQRVGWIFGHPARDKGLILNASEVIMAAELQLEAAGGIEETPFVTVKAFPKADGTISVEAFQVSQQCMEMVAEQALEIGSDPAYLHVNETFTAVKKLKDSKVDQKTVENEFFIKVVPIITHKSDIFVSEFPWANREYDDRTPSHDELKRQLSKSGSSGWTFIDLLSDFNLLIYLSKFLDVNADFPRICQSVVDRDVPLDDGYKIIITSMAGVSGAY